MRWSVRPSLAILLAAGWLLSRGSAPAAEPGLAFQRILPEEGLSQGYVTSILQDHQGFMWFGTQEGLNRFDGVTFASFGHEPGIAASLSADLVGALLEDRRGRLWVGTEKGLDRLDPVTGGFVKYRHRPEDRGDPGAERVRALLEDTTGSIWVGTNSAGLSRIFRGSGSLQRYPWKDDAPLLSSQNIRDLAAGPDGSLWVATEGGGLNRLNLNTFELEVFRHDPSDARSLADDRVRCVLADDQGRLWVGTYDAGLDLLEPGTGSFRHFTHDGANPGSLPSNRVRALLRDHRGVVWVASEEGLSEWLPAEGRFRIHRSQPEDRHSLLDNLVVSLYEDRSGVLWIGTASGINRWNSNGGLFFHFAAGDDSRKGEAPRDVMAMVEDRDGGVWLGSYGGGLSRLDRSTGLVTSFSADRSAVPALSDDRVTSLLADRAGGLWAGTKAGGLNKIHLGARSLRVYRHDPTEPGSLSSNGVTSLLQDRLDRIWVGTYGGGLNLLRPGEDSFARYRHRPGDPESLSSDRVLALFEDREARLWIGTDGGGLNLFNAVTGRFTAFRHIEEEAESLSSDSVLTINEDQQGNLWIGTRGGGLNMWAAADRQAARARFRHFTKRDGLPSRHIYGAELDSLGNLWVSSSGGLSMVNPETGSVRTYDADFGIRNEFHVGASVATSDGSLFFGGVNGFHGFRPEDLQPARRPPPVVLTSFLKFNRPVELGRPLSEIRELVLRHQDSNLSFEYVALDFAAPEQNRYRYKLEGFEREWVEAGGRRHATYTNLAPGTYTFRVVAANSDGIWSPEGASVRLRVLPPPWRTGWAYGFYLLAAGLSGTVVLTGYRRRARQAAAIRLANLNLEREVGERKAKEEALRKEKVKAQKYLEVAEVIMLALDRTGRVRLINLKGCQVLGRPEAEILGKDWFETFVPTQARERARHHMTSHTAPGFVEYPVQGAGGEERTIAWHTTALELEEGDSVVLCSGSDVTQVRELERQLRVSHKMDAIGTLAGGIAHDFNNILTSILGYTAMSLQSLPAEGEHVENLNQVYRAGLRAKGLVNRILTFSRRGEQEVKPLRLSSILDEVVRLLRSTLPSTIVIRTWIDPECPPVRADATEIHQLLMNLSTNSFQAMEEHGGVLEISLAKVDLDEEECQAHPDLSPGPHAEIVITDTGCGMDRSTIDRIFEPFFTTKGVGKGTGLGLSVVHGIVKRHRGDISVASRIGEGTSFRVLMPVCDDQPSEEAAFEAGAESGGESILFVDDEKPIAALGKRMLQRLGYQVSACSSSAEALEVFRADPAGFDLMITDRTMPEMTGIALAEKILGIRPDLPVILASGGAEGTSASNGIRHFIQKPFSLEEIDRVVRQALG